MSLWDRIRSTGGETSPSTREIRSSRALEGLKVRLKKIKHAQLLDMGYTTGANIDFFVKLGCRVHVDDYIESVIQKRPRPEANKKPVRPAAGLRADGKKKAGKKPRVQVQPLEYENGQFDVVLCWDLFDYLTPDEAVQTGREIRRIIGDGGLLLAYFGPRPTDEVRAPHRFRIRDDGIEVCDVVGPDLRPFHLANRDVQRIFPDFELAQTVLLKSGVREMLLRKKASAGQARSATMLRALM